MSFHILHILQPGAFLAKERGFLICRPPEESGKPSRRMALEDIRAIVIAARGVTLSATALAALLEHEAIILHCNEKYQPCGVTAPLPRIVDTTAFLHQSSRPEKLNRWLWDRLLRGKTQNQQGVLKSQNLFSQYLENSLQKKRVDEGTCARKYWQLYFPSIGWGGTSRAQRSDTAPNQRLNYGYTVLATLCHRALLVHGLSPLLGVGHLPRFRSAPLVYDLMEPYRPFVDRLLARFMMGADLSAEAWARRVGAGLREERVTHERYHLKLMDAIDKSAASLARSYRDLTAGPLWLPELSS
jgi:CRISP-associated protein Cas1